MSNLPLPTRPTTTTGSAAISAEQATLRRRVRPLHAGASLLAAASAGLLVWAFAVVVGGLPLEVSAAGRTVGPVSVVLAALLPGAAAGGLLALLIRRRHGSTV